LDIFAFDDQPPHRPWSGGLKSAIFLPPAQRQNPDASINYQL
jgi:hypothetical protein